MNKLFTLANRFLCKLAREKPNINDDMSLMGFMIEEDMSEFRMGDVVYSVGNLAEVHKRQATTREESWMPDMASAYHAWWQDWDPQTEMYPEEAEDHVGKGLTSDELDRMEKNLTEKDLGLVDRRISFIYEQLRERLSQEDLQLFIEAVNLSAKLEEWRTLLMKK